MTRIATAALLLLLACDESEPNEPLTTDATTMSTTAVATTASAEESSSSSGDAESSSSTEPAPWEPQPYGPCEYDAACHCENDTCVAACDVDADCSGSAICIEHGCYIECGLDSQCKDLFPNAAPNGLEFTCRSFPSLDVAWDVCLWE